jgi:uncharacterized YigZ family protein
LDTYKTISVSNNEILLKEKNSKFFGYGYPVESAVEIKSILEDLRKKYPKAGHFCYAYQIGTDKIEFRVNDDGEPKNSAGLPIYGQIQSFGITNVLIVIVRFFGGTKLGVSGLISAYKSTAQLVIENSIILEKTINKKYLITFDYKNIDKVMRIIKENNAEIIFQKIESLCQIEILIRKKYADRIADIFKNLFEINIELIQ